MDEKKYLKWYNKVGYGSGDIAGNIVYVLQAAFLMVYVTDTLGLNPGIVGTLILIARLCDGPIDLAIGALIDRTRTKMGKARPWMFWAYFGCAVTLVALFSIPLGMGDVSQYVWFFIAYVLLNAVFFTGNNIAFSALTALITKNSAERVQMGSIRFMFAFGTNMLIQVITVQAVQAFGGGAQGWRMVAIIFAIVGLLVNTLSVFSVRELPEDVLNDQPDGGEAPEQPRVLESLKLLLTNRFYLLIVAVFVLGQVFTAMLSMGIYFMKDILGDANLLGTFAVAVNAPMIVGLMATPFLVKWLKRIYPVNLVGYAIALVGRLLVIAAAAMGSIPLMLVFSALASLGMSSLQGTLNALIAEASEHTFLAKKKRIDGMMYSAASLGVKIGGGGGTALAGWLLAASGYVGGAATQPESATNMISFMYLWIPAIVAALVLVLLVPLKVEQANEKLRREMATSELVEG